MSAGCRNPNPTADVRERLFRPLVRSVDNVPSIVPRAAKAWDFVLDRGSVRKEPGQNLASVPICYLERWRFGGRRAVLGVTELTNWGIMCYEIDQRSPLGRLGGSAARASCGGATTRFRPDSLA